MGLNDAISSLIPEPEEELNVPLVLKSRREKMNENNKDESDDDWDSCVSE